MNKILIAAFAVLVTFTTAANANKNHNHNNYCVDCNQYNYNNGHHHNNNFYNDPNFWWGVGGGLLGGAVINGLTQPQYYPSCYWVNEQVYDVYGNYVFRRVQVCN